ncbi:unnamed protein product [Somion occarium]|uniref:PB1 domain-containing protein n=1 Tax=Somion occarium TaxID=3059160 RepID=A0ABP1CHI6_9APHY
MSRTLFKFTKPPDGLTRRVMFYSRPPWSELAAKIEELYAVPSDKVGVSYVDNEGDDVTLSSEEELQDFYRLNHTDEVGDGPSKAIRFTVVDLSAPRSPSLTKPLPRTPHTDANVNRNTFGGTQGFPLVFEVADDWQRIPSGGGADLFMSVGRDTDSPHAFVEVIDSDASMSKDVDKDDHSDTVTQSDFNFDGKDKGKGRAPQIIPDEDDDDRSSTMSILAGETPLKPTVYATQDKSKARASSTSLRDQTPASAVVSRRCTPKPSVNTKDVPSGAPDPPLPDLGSLPNTPNASLTNDVANLFNSLSSIFASHPELSEGVRNIVQHATNGAYWNTHRIAVAQAAEEVRRTAIESSRDIQRAAQEVHRAAEEAAGRRVAEAIGNVVRTITDITVTSTPIHEHPQTSSAEFPHARRTGSPTRRQTWGGSRGRHHHRPPFGPHERAFGPFGPFAGPFSDMSHMPPFNEGMIPPFHSPHGPHRPHRPPYPPPPPPPFDPFGPPHRGPHDHHGPVRPPPPPPPPFQSGPYPPPPPPPPAPPIVPPGPMFSGPGLDTSFRHGGHFTRWSSDPFTSGANDDDDEFDEPDLTLHTGAPLSRSASLDQEHQVTRERLEAAKEAYKREKERYRKQREELKKEREKRGLESEGLQPNDQATPVAKATSSGPQGAGPSGSTPKAPPPPPVTQLVSNARGPYPQLEMFSVPRRHNTIQGVARERPIPRQDPQIGPSHIYSPFTPTPAARTSENVKRRLADMGFTTNIYPNIGDKVAKRVSQSIASQSFTSPKDLQDVPKEKEDSIVSEVLEELLQEPPPPLPEKDRPSGSGEKPGDNESVPGAWA